VLRASTAIEDWTALRRHLPVFRAAAGPGNANVHMFLRTFEAHLSLQDGRLVEALGTLRELATKLDLLEATYLDVAVLTRLALLELAEGSPTAAWRALEPLIERVESRAGVGHALSAGVHVLTQLSLASWDGAASREGLATLHRWVELARRFKAGVQKKPRAPAAQQDAGLSHRELEVLALLAEGQSNKLIARALDLSPHTIKRHVARILDRLDLASRMQAADWYRTHLGS
jgi:LuxR family transcriptional regulator, maltose regulon positive regulatory protein